MPRIMNRPSLVPLACALTLRRPPRTSPLSAALLLREQHQLIGLRRLPLCIAALPCATAHLFIVLDE